MKTKQLLLAAVGVVALSSAAFGQAFPAANTAAGITVAPYPFRQDQAITLTVDVSRIYPRSGPASLRSTAVLFIHSGVNAGKAGDNATRWKNVVGNWRDYPAASQFVRRGTTSVFDLRITPTAYYKLAGDPPASDAVFSEMCMVFNDGGPSTQVGEGGTADATDATKKSDVFIPVNAATSVKNNDVFTAATSYPNPFTEVVNISFGLKTGGPVTLRIFDAKGNEVKTLVNGQFFAGNALHIMQWDATNNAGLRVGNGAYFYRLENNGATETGSMRVIR
jgi:FlgD Ig-like domain